MTLKTFSAALAGFTMLAAPAFAQAPATTPPATSPPPAATAPAPAAPSTSVKSSSSTNKNEQNASATGEWQGSKLIGLNVYNSSNEKIGDIKELMVNKDGKIDTVAIGVGGFLGMGEHDVAVKFSELKFSDTPVPSKTSSTKGSAGTTGAGTSTTTSSSTKHNYPDHATLDSTKDQLKQMPQFNYNK